MSSGVQLAFGKRLLLRSSKAPATSTHTDSSRVPSAYCSVVSMANRHTGSGSSSNVRRQQAQANSRNLRYAGQRPLPWSQRVRQQTQDRKDPRSPRGSGIGRGSLVSRNPTPAASARDASIGQESLLPSHSTSVIPSPPAPSPASSVSGTHPCV